MGKAEKPKDNNRGAVADSAIKIIRVLSGRWFRGRRWSVGYAIAHPRLSPRCRSVRVLSGRPSQLLSSTCYITKGVNTGTRGTVVLPVIYFASITTDAHRSCYLLRVTSQRTSVQDVTPEAFCQRSFDAMPQRGFSFSVIIINFAKDVESRGYASGGLHLLL